MSGLRFEPGETAILLNSGGGRLFIVDQQVSDDEVIERHPIPSQQKYVQPMRTGRLIKVRTAAMAHELIGRFKEVAETRDKEINAANHKAERRFSSLEQEYRVESEESE